MAPRTFGNEVYHEAASKVIVLALGRLFGSGRSQERFTQLIGLL